ncbi:hypothetical protein ACIQTZ_13235 [Paenarthrobacter sp. NPDC090520]|uniref:hypothetical protein n=1 Tax=Paenarthrobacter sp. NPDC090520 TaxID=3364382 RepID=UPI0037FF012A
MHLSLFIREGLENVRHRPVQSSISIVLAIAVGFCITVFPGLEVERVTRLALDEVNRGLHVAVVTDKQRNPLSATRCESLTKVEGIKYAGGVLASHRVYSPMFPVDGVDLLEVSPSWVKIVWPSLSEPGEILAGPRLAQTLGLVSGAKLPIANTKGLADLHTLTITGMPAATPRSERYDNALIAVGAVRGTVGECVVQFEPSKFWSASAILTHWFGGSEIVTRMLYTRPDTQPSPQVQLESMLLKYLPVAGFAIIALAFLSQVASRRQELALYRVIGSNSQQVLTLLCSEFFLRFYGPLIFGTTTGSFLFLTHLKDSALPSSFSYIEGLVLLASLLPMPMVGLAALSSVSVPETFRGRE